MTAEPASPRELLKRTLAHFDCLDPTSLAAVVSAFKPRKVARDARLSRNGERCGGIGFVVEGVFVSGLVGPEKKALSDIFCEGDFATDYVSFLTGAPSTVDIVALEDSKTLWLTHADLQTLYATVPNAERLGRYIAEGQFISLVERTAALLTQSPAARASLQGQGTGWRAFFSPSWDHRIFRVMGPPRRGVVVRFSGSWDHEIFRVMGPPSA